MLLQGGVEMKRRMILLTVVTIVECFCISMPNVYAQKDVIGMVTGSKMGTYYAFGQDVARIAKQVGIEIEVKESKGSIANILRLDSDENAAFAIIQHDVLWFMQHAQGAQDLQRTVDKLVMIFPFYNEEVHLFARKEIKTFSDLEGKRVVVGADGSGNFITASNLLQLLHVRPGTELNFAPEDAVEAVLMGNADAMFYVAGKPVKLFTNLEKLQSDPKYMPLLENVHFVPLGDQGYWEQYVPSELSTQDYGWLKESVPTVAVKAVLVSYDFSSKATPYYQHRCNQLAILGKAVMNSLNDLRSNGHQKWNEVNLDDDFGNMKVDECSHNLMASHGSSGAPEVDSERLQAYQKKLRCTISGGEWNEQTGACEQP
jgi:TRAP transporter TAXI family solute receptor